MEARTAPGRALRLRDGAAGIGLGCVLWIAWGVLRGVCPEVVRFSFALLLFTFGAGALLTVRLMSAASLLEWVGLSAGVGTAVAPIIAELLARMGLGAAFPYIASALAGLAVVLRRGAPGHSRSTRESRVDLFLAAGVVSLALTLGGIVFAHRLVATPSSVMVYGDYDSVDLSYYAAITSELSHTVPPQAPFYAGHPLNYSWYPHLLLAEVHRFGDVPVLSMYFRLAWPAFLAVGALVGFLFVRHLAGRAVAALGITLLLIGGDFSYLAAWFLSPSTYLWDFLLWPTNFLAATMEVLHFSTWTPSLPVFFAGLYAVRRRETDGQTGWLLLAALCFGSLLQFKTFAFAILMAGLVAAAVMPVVSRRGRKDFAALALLSAAIAAPFLYRIAMLYAESRSRLKFDFALLPRLTLDKTDLAGWAHAVAARVAPAGPVQAAVLLILATMVFLAGGLGMRWIGIPGVWRAVSRRDAGSTWALLGWSVVAGVLVPFVLVTEPYHDTLQFYQTALFLLWIFSARALAGIGSRGVRAAAIALVIAGAVPSSIHYVREKAGDGPNHLLASLSSGELRIARQLRRTNPATTVVLHDAPAAPSLIAIESERRTVLSWARYVTGSGARQRDVERFFDSAAADPAAALETLRRYGVTHVVVRSRNNVHPAVLARLRELLRTPDAILFEVPDRF